MKPPPLLLKLHTRLSVRVKQVMAFALLLVFLSGFAVVLEMAPGSPDDPVFEDPAAGRDSEVTPKEDNQFAVDGPVDVSWPVRDSVELSGSGDTVVGGLPVSLRSAGTVTVDTFDRDLALRAGVPGTLVKVTADQQISLSVEYSTFAAGYGGDYGARLKLYLLPECDVVTVNCAAEAVPLTTSNDGEQQSLSATIPHDAAGTMLAIAAAADSSQGSFAATPLAMSSQWNAGDASGAFNWSYPIDLPNTLGGLVPGVSLSYSSQTVDGRTASTNNQGSWIGEGFSYEPGYIERRYKPCDDDGVDGKFDQCWAFDNATIMLSGASGSLVKDGDTWRSSADNAAKIERLTGADNGDNDGEYWKVTTPDGTQYYFGMHQRPGWATGDAVTNSVWTTPVYGNDAGEPCYNASLENAHCDQAWRWNLDYVVDPLGNVVSYIYGKESNHYALGGDASVNGAAYTRGGYLKRIDYGQRDGEVHDSPAPARVIFTTAERCLPSGSITCAPEQLTDDNALHWPDVPFDKVCEADAPCELSQATPSFFTRKRLTDITTEVYSEGAYNKVDSWALNHTFVSNGDVTRTLWLDSITRTGHTADTSITLPPTELLPVQKENRVDVIGDSISPLVRPRLATIYYDSGGQLEVVYSDQDCAPGDTPTPKSNNRLCYPVIWQPGSYGEEITDWFHKYVVTEVIASDRVGESPSQTTRYDYRGGAAWRHAEPDGITDEKFLTWSDWRGYGELSVIGAPDSTMQTRIDYTYLRGMHGDDDGAGGTRVVDVTDSTGTAHRDYNEFSGQLLESIVYDGQQIVSKTISTPWRHTTATETHPWGKLAASFVRPHTTSHYEWLGSDTWRQTRTTTEYDDTYGRVVSFDDEGEVGKPGDEVCTRTWYVDNIDKWMVTYPNHSRTVSIACDATIDQTQDVLDETRTFYDGGAFGDPPSRGLATEDQIRTGYDGTNPIFLTVSKSVFDEHGRPTSVKDAHGIESTVSYTDVDNRNVSVTGTNALGHTQVTTTDALRGLPLTITDANGKKTETAYDALGRVSGVWPSHHTNNGTREPWYTYEYINTENAPVAIVSRNLKNNAIDYELSSVVIFDGWIRQRQVQVPGPEGTRLNTDSIYDMLGRQAKTNNTYHAQGAPDPGSIVIVKDVQVDGQTITEFDQAGRVIASVFQVAGTEKWRTTYEHGGDRTHVTPPDGASGTTAISDARGQIVEQRQYRTREPSGAYDSTFYTYTTGGHLESVTDSVGNVWSYEYDARGRLTTSSDPDAGDSSYEYDDLDRLTSVTDGRGEKTSTVYDDLGRVTATWSGDSVTGTQLTRRVWDPAGYKGYESLVFAYSEDFTFATKYETRDWNYAPLRVSYFAQGEAAGGLEGQYIFRSAFNKDGSLQRYTWPDVADMPSDFALYDYDELGRISSVGSLTSTWVSSIRHTPKGLPSSIHYPLAGTTAKQVYQYESGTNRLQRYWLTKDDVAGTIADIHYSYDDIGNVRAVIDDPSADGSVRDAQCFTYDHARRLTNAWTSAASGTTAEATCSGGPTATGVGGPAPYWQSYDFDATGNRTSLVNRNSADLSTGTTTTYQYPQPGAATEGPHRLTSMSTGTASQTSYMYDDAGNTISVDRDGSLQTLTWNANGKVDTVTQGDEHTKYAYDADGNQVLRTDSTGTTLYLPGMELREDAVSGAVTCTMYIALPGGVSVVKNAGGSQWQFSDHHGTATIGIDGATGTVEHRYSDPYGNPRGATPQTWLGQKGFVGGSLNDSTGYTTMGARQYDPLLGRFLSVDPIIDVSDPTQINPYLYAKNNPATLSDASGLFPCYADHASGNYCPAPFDQDGADEQAIRDEERNKALDDAGVNQSDIDDAWDVMNTDIVDIIIDVGAEILLDMIGVNDIKSCVSDGDIWACVSLALDVIPITKIFSVGKKLYKAGKKILSAVNSFNQKLEKAKGVLNRVGDAMKTASDRARKRIADLRSSRADAADSAAGKCNSFTSDAKVVMADGTARPIAEVAIGDEVLSTDPVTGETNAQLVTALPRTGTPDDEQARDLVTVTVDEDADGTGDGQITSTAGHAYWTADTVDGDGYWAPARDLVTGAWLRTSSGTWVQTTAITAHTTQTHTYNLTIANHHTYYVTTGNTNTLVHNCSARFSVDSSGVATDLHAASVSQENLDRAFELANTPSKLEHVIDPAKHGFSDIVKASGGRSEAMKSIVDSLSVADGLPGVGKFEVQRMIYGQAITIRGAMVNGIPRIGTAFDPLRFPGNSR